VRIAAARGEWLRGRPLVTYAERMVPDAGGGSREIGGEMGALSSSECPDEPSHGQAQDQAFHEAEL
jgi:hypothetical protein